MQPLNNSASRFMSSTPKTKGVRFGGSKILNDLDIAPLSIEDSPAVTALLHDKLEEQQKVIEHLIQVVNKIEGERAFYKGELKNIQQELTRLHERVHEKGVDVQTERKIEQWKRGMASEMSQLQGQVEQYQRSNDTAHMGAGQLASLTRDIQDLRRYIQDECDSIRREVDSIKTRSVKTELEGTSLRSDNQDLSRRYDKMERTLREQGESQQIHQRTVNRQMDDNDLEKHQIAELHTSMTALRERLTQVESHSLNLLRSQSRPTHTPELTKSNRKKHRDRRKKGPADILSIHSSDLDLSSSLSLADYSLGSSQPDLDKERNMTGFTEELDELNLSDTDSASIDSLDLDAL